jgi:uncharacterized protein
MEAEGALTENFVYQSLVRQYEVPPRYWTQTPYEVDFIIQRENDIFPVEAKAGVNVRATSLKKYAGKYEDDTPLMVRLSLRNLSLDGKILNVPLFMIDELDSLIGIALKSVKSE